MYRPDVDATGLVVRVNRVFGKYQPEWLAAVADPRIRSAVDTYIADLGDCLAILFADSENFTVLTHLHIVWRYQGACFSLSLSRVTDGYVMMTEGSDADVAGKAGWNCVRFPHTEHSVWTPSAGHATLLLNVLAGVMRKNRV